MNHISEICRPKMRLCTTPVRKTGKKSHKASNIQSTKKEKAQKVSIIRPINTRKHPSEEIPTNMQEPEDTHPGTRHRTASHKAMAPHPRHMILIKSRPVAKSPQKRQVKERCRNRSKRTQRWFLHVYCLKISPGKETANSTRCMPRILHKSLFSNAL